MNSNNNQPFGLASRNSILSVYNNTHFLREKTYNKKQDNI